jgi:hypothetical protein
MADRRPRSSPTPRARVREGDVGPELRTAPEPPGERRPVCSVALCPICMAVTAAGDARSDVLEHLLSAGREVLLAVRAVIDARLEGAEPPTRLERIAVD